MKIKKGDNVIVIAGKDNGKTGKVVKSFPKEGMVIVEGINKIKKHQRPTKSGAKGQIIEKPMPMNASNVMILEGGKGVRVGRKEIGGKNVRISKKSGKEI
jgi:large subunit ribosomal protein L24